MQLKSEFAADSKIIFLATYAGEETGEAATSTLSTNTSAGTTSSLGIFEYGIELEGSQNDIVTAVALPPVLLHIRRRRSEPLKNTGSVSYKYPARKKIKSFKALKNFAVVTTIDISMI
ncbi:unnamed protein product [Cylicostephanus goldi]|uniref:Uncharacterized protein n=1 Tax=Cylicostephanus goldi TaxID=71465 RepID=A0A3P6T0Z2_CYLGO|nr:unnamed protein product [Cylicostephanus goldi]